MVSALLFWQSRLIMESDREEQEVYKHDRREERSATHSTH